MRITSPLTEPVKAPDSGGQSRLNTNLAFTFYYAFKTLPFVVAALSIYLGYRLFILGVTGKASLSLVSDTLKGQLLNAAPGLFFAVGGIVLAVVTIWKGVQVDFNDSQRIKSHIKNHVG